MNNIDFGRASVALRSYYSVIGNARKPLPRHETNELVEWAVSSAGLTEEERVSFLLGKAGEGKTVIMKMVYEQLEERGYAVLGLKMDTLFDSSSKGLDELVGFGVPVYDAVQQMAASGKRVIVLIDQVDAISVTLTTDRHALEKVVCLINDLMRNPDVRIIVSSRPYDYHCDLKFDRFRKCKTVTVRPLTKEQIVQTLKDNDMPSDVSGELMTFLSVPLHLYYYCRAKSIVRESKKLTIQYLYNCLWENVVVNGVWSDYGRLVDALEHICEEMIEKQVLSLNMTISCDAYQKEVNYLASNDVLNVDRDTNRVQFRHQTLFDFTYARIFFYRKKDIVTEFSRVHQGLFLRPRLRSILDYLHEADSTQYLRTLNIIISKQNEDGSDVFRFQLRQLAIASLANYEELTIAEQNYIKQTIYPNETYRTIYFDALFVSAGFDLLTRVVQEKGGLEICDPLCAVWNDTATRFMGIPEKALQILQIWRNMPKSLYTAEMGRRFGYCLNYCLADDVKVMDEAWTLAQKMNSIGLDVELCEFYKRQISYRTDEVCDRMRQIIVGRAEDTKDYIVADLKVNWDEDAVLKEIKAKNTVAFVSLVGRILEELPGNKALTKYKRLYSCKYLIVYQRNADYSHGVEQLVDEAIDAAKEAIMIGDEMMRNLIRSYAWSKYEAQRLIGLYTWQELDIVLVKDIYDYLKDNILRDYNSAQLTYLHVHLLERVFLQLNTRQQKTLLRRVADVNPARDNVSMRDYWGKYGPITFEGETRGKYWNVIPREVLRKYDAYWGDYQRISRKYRHLQSDPPFSTSCHSGYSTMDESAYANMRDEQVLESMREYNDDDHINWERPTLTGHSSRLKDMAIGAPERFAKIYASAVKDETISIRYVVDGVSGLISASYDVRVIEPILRQVIARLGMPLEKEHVGEAVTVIRMAEDFVKHGIEDVPSCLMNFVCTIARTTDDSDIEPEKDFMNNLNMGINRLRGAAVAAMEDVFLKLKPYQEQTVETLEKIGSNASMATRAVVLHQLGVVWQFDHERAKNIFFAVIDGYPPALISQPLHNRNILIYLLKNYYGELGEYFEACLEMESAYASTEHLLWWGYLDGKEECKQMLLRFVDRCEEGKVQLLKNAILYYSLKNIDQTRWALQYALEHNPTERVYTVFDELFRCIRVDSIPYEPLKDELDMFFKQGGSRYCKHQLMEFMKHVAEKDAVQCLKWLPWVLQNHNQMDGYDYAMKKMVDTLIYAYNNLVQFYVGDEYVERAMDLFDDMMRTGKGTQLLETCLKEAEK